MGINVNLFKNYNRERFIGWFYIFQFELRFHKAYNLPTVNCCPLCYVASTWLVPPPRGPALQRVGPAIKPCARSPPASPRSTTVTTATQEPVSPLAPPPKVVGAGNGLDAIMSSRTARKPDAKKPEMPALRQPRSAHPRVSPTPFLRATRRGQIQQTFREL